MISKNALIFICVSFIFTSRLFGQTMAPDLGSLNLSLNNEASLNSRPLSAKEEEALRLSLEFNSRPLKPIKGVDGKIMYVYGSSLPLVIGSPMNISDIEFEKGESVNEILVGDSFRWLIESGSSGDGITHVFVKPLDSGLETSLVVTTNRRVYHIQLVSRQTGFTPYIGFLYSSQLEPIVRKEAKEKEWRTAFVDGGQPVDMSNLNFSYQVKGKASWKPVMIYDDGLKMYIRLPESAIKSEIPILLVKQGKQNTLVNYRLKFNTFEVDGLFDDVILITGVGGKQEKIEIIKEKRIQTVFQGQ